MAFISGEQWNKGQILRGTKTILGNREHKENTFSIFGEQGNTPIYFRRAREQVPPRRASFIRCFSYRFHNIVHGWHKHSLFCESGLYL